MLCLDFQNKQLARRDATLKSELSALENQNVELSRKLQLEMDEAKSLKTKVENQKRQLEHNTMLLSTIDEDAASMQQNAKASIAKAHERRMCVDLIFVIMIILRKVSVVIGRNNVHQV